MNLISAFDLHFEEALYAIRDPLLLQFFSLVTWLGEAWVVLGFTAVVVIVLAYRKRWMLAAGLLTSVGGGIVATGILKHVIERPRPPANIAAYLETTSSFPSLHATLAVALYAFLLWLIWDSLSPVQKKVKIAAVAVLIIAIGFSRLYLGVHYPSDVLAGYILGGIFVLLGIKVAKYIEKKKATISSV